MKKILSVILALTLALSLCACGGLTEGSAPTKEPTPTEAPAAGGETAPAVEATPAAEGEAEIPFEDTVIRVAISADPGNLGPFAANNTGRKQTLYSIYQPLAEILPGGEVHLVLAKSYEMIDTYTFNVTIWDNITDSDGNKITADDVVWSYTNEDAVAKSQIIKYIDSITALDETTVQFKLNTTMISAPERVLYTWIVSQKAYEDSGDKMAARPVGTGGYIMTDYVEGASMVMEAREDYWKPEADRDEVEAQNVKRMEFYIIAESAQQVVGLETDLVDVVSNMSSSQVGRFENDENYTIFEDLSNTTYTMFFNCDPSATTSNPAVRQAICYAIDAQGIIDGAADGAAQKAFAYGSPVFADILESWAGSDYYEYNPEKAMELLKEAGFKDGDVTVRFLLRSLELDQEIGLIVQGYLEAVGIKCELNIFEETLAKTYVRDHATWDLYLRNAGQDIRMVHGWNNDFSEKNWADGIGYNGIKDEKFEELLQTCQNADTYTDEAMTELHNYMTENVYAYGLFQPKVYTVCKSGTLDSLLYNSSYWLFPGACGYAWSN